MNKWIEDKWNWYISLPWYWKLLAVIIGIALIILMVLSIIAGNRPIINPSGSDKHHDQMVQQIKEDREKLEHELAEKAEKLKNQISKIEEKEKKVQEKADEIEKQLKDAKSVDEVRKILKERGKS